jgi:hypothetical protein
MDEEVSFLETRPPHWAANGLAYLVIAVVALAAVAAVAVQVPETISSPFVLVPCSGALLRQQVEASEAYIDEGDLPSELACAGEKLQAKLILPESGSARIQPGQGVTLLYDAFPYGRYGVRYGTVRWVSSSAVHSPQNSRSFYAFADIDDKAIMVDGRPRPLHAGMGGTARVALGKRPLISYAVDPLRQLKESFAEPPKRRTEEKPS